MTSTVFESKTLNHISGTVIIMAGSGMCEGGRIKHHLAHNISRKESTILFVGYQAVGTLGRQIVEGEREVRIFGEMFPVKAKVTQIHGFSAHADRDDLLAWFKSFQDKPKVVCITHGEPDAANALAKAMKNKFHQSVKVVSYQEKFTL
jgi:metallo-beta-lactamase family protein